MKSKVKSKVNAEKINAYWRQNPHMRSRTMRYEAIKDLFGIDHQTALSIISLDRLYRELPKNTRTDELEDHALSVLGYAPKQRIPDRAVMSNQQALI